MNESNNKINPEALKVARKRRKMSQQQLADAVREIAKGCTKDTVSRWERGVTRSIREYFRKPLCKVLRVDWEQLTEPPDQSEKPVTFTRTTVPVKTALKNSLHLVAERYGIDWQEVLELAPLLFLIVAERSLLKRERRVQEIYAIWEETEDRLVNDVTHLGGIVAARSISADEQLHEEEKSLSKKDVFGRTITYEFGAGENEGPFIHYIRDLVKSLPKESVLYIESDDGDTIDIFGYRIAEDTLRKSIGLECLGDSLNEKDRERFLNFLRFGDIDFAECMRVKRNMDAAIYRKWVSDELVRIDKLVQPFDPSDF